MCSREKCRSHKNVLAISPQLWREEIVGTF